MIKKSSKFFFIGKPTHIACMLMFSTLNILETQALTNYGFTIDQSQDIVTGRVSSGGTALANVNIKIKEKPEISVSSNSDGSYSIAAAQGQTLIFSAIGFQTKEILITTSQLNVFLENSISDLDEVVVVGFGTQKKENLTGSVASLDLSNVQNRVQPNLASAIQGTTPGVTVISRPGSTPSINIRGRGNLGSSSPLYVIDGAISDGTVFSNLDPSMIKSVSFLKDAAASAIYGSRAAYGVILVTTKNGSAGQMQISYSGYAGFRSPTYLPKIVNSSQYALLLNEGMYNRNPSGGFNQAYTDEQILKFSNGSDLDNYPNTNWFDIALDNKVPTTNHNISLNGGSEKITYYTALGYNQDRNFTPGSHNKRYNLQTNLSSDIKKWLTLKANVSYIRNQGNVDNGIPSLANFLLVPPTMVAKHSNGEWGSIAGGAIATQSFLNGNPLRAYSKNNWSNNSTENTVYNLGFDLKPFEGLKISGQGIMNRTEYKYKAYTALQPEINNFITGAPIPGTGVYTNQMNMNWTSNQRMQYLATAEYQKTLGKHDLKGLLGMSYEDYSYQALSASRRNFPSDNLIDLNAGSTAGEDISNGGGMLDNKLLSYFGRINYVYDNKYLFEANFRADASTSFYKNNRWGYFPSFSAGWKLNEEEFLRNVNWIDDLKVRASWGKLGNINNVGYYDYFQTFSIFPAYSFNDQAVTGTNESKPANTGLTWETVTMTNFGIDGSILNGKLGIVADYYIKETNDILLAYNTPLEIGLTSNPSQNIGTVKNKGFELTLTHRNNIGAVKYQLAANITTNKNRITNLGASDNMISNGGDKIRYINKVGEAIGSYYGYVTDGLYTQEEIDKGEYYTFGRIPNAGDIKYIPQREGVAFGQEITGEDRAVIGVDVPTFTYGLNLNLEYKDFFLSIFGQGVHGTSVGFESEQVWALFLNSAPREYHLGRWNMDNPNPRAIYPRIYGGTSLDNYNQNFSDFQLFDADYFRFKTISLGYSLSNSFTERIKIKGGKVFLTGENLFTIRMDDKMKDFDPESSTGRGLGALGIKSLALGLNINF